MSGSLADLHLAKTFDPRLDLDKKRYYTVLQGPTQNTMTIDKSTTYSNSSVIHSIIAPSTNAVFSRRVYLKWRMRLTFNITAAAQGNAGGLQLKAFGTNSFDALRCNPISSILQTAQMSINNETFSVNLADHIQPLTRYHSYDKLNYEMSLSPSMPDQSLNYSDTVSSQRDALADYKDNSAMLPRGASVWYSNLSALQNGVQTVDVEVIEPLFLSPLIWGKYDKDSGFVGIQTIKFIFNLGQANRMWSHVYQSANNAEVNTITSIQMQFPEAPELLYNFCSISEVGVKYDPMEKYVYPYYELVNYSTPQTATLAPQASANVTTANIQLSSVPNKLYFFLSEDKTSLLDADAEYKSDSFARINNISVQFNNQTGILSSANSQQLYLISVANGLNMSYQQWRQSCGSVLCLQFGKDIPLPADLAPGALGSFQLQITANYTNQILASYVNPKPSGTKTFMPWIVVVSEGTLTVHNQRYTRNVGVLSRSDVVSVAAMEDVPIIPYEETDTLYGGSFLSGLKSAFSRVGDLVKTGFSHLKKSGAWDKIRDYTLGKIMPPGADVAASTALKSIGLGSTGGVLTGLEQNQPYGGRRKGMRGGKIMSRRELMEALHQ